MRPDKLYAPDAPKPKQTMLYTMINTDGTCKKTTLACLNSPSIMDIWNQFINKLQTNDTAILYQSIYEIDVRRLNKTITMLLIQNDFCTTPQNLIDIMVLNCDGTYGTMYKDLEKSWSASIDTSDENEMLDIQTKLLKYIDCNNMSIHQTPNGYQFIFHTDENQYDIQDILETYSNVKLYETMLPIAWQTKQ
jgi:hypothetical protein